MLAGHLLPERFLLCAAVGASGVLVQLAALAALRHALPFAAAQACAVWLAMTFNYLLNNAITWRDRRLRGWQFWRDLAAFYVICSTGAVANVGVGTLLYARGGIWWLAGRQCDRGSGVELRREPLLHVEWRVAVKKRHGLRAGGAHPMGVRALVCEQWIAIHGTRLVRAQMLVLVPTSRCTTPPRDRQASVRPDRGADPTDATSITGESLSRAGVTVCTS